MATSLPWSVKGVDPRTRDAAKAAARRAGMTLGQWLDHKIREESEAEDPARAEAGPPEQLDIAALSERLARLSQGQMETAPAARVPPAPSAPDMSPRQVEAVIAQAAAAERVSREASAKTAGALDSIARWIEKTEHRLSSGERSVAERQERATSVIADAIKTMGERIVDIERKSVETPRMAPAAASVGGRPVLSRDGLAAVVTDIRTRQRLLDADAETRPAARTQGAGAAMDERRLAAMRDDLRSLSARLPQAQEPQPQPRPQMRTVTQVAPQTRDAGPIEALISDLGARLDRLDRRDRMEPILKPLARIETEVARLAQDRQHEGYQRFELEIAHLAAKVDALVARGGDRSALNPVLRDIGELREMIAATSGDERLGDLARQVSGLASEVGRLRDSAPDGRELRSLSLAIEDVRDAVLADRSQDRFFDNAPLLALSRQVEALAGKLDALPAMRPETISAQADQLAARLGELDASGRSASDALAQRIETLISSLENLAARQPAGLDRRIDALQQRIEMLADHGPTAVTRQIEALAGRIESLAASGNLVQMAGEQGAVSFAKVDLRPLEEMLRGLADKIDDVGRPGVETDSFDALEQQIAGLAARLDEAAATRSAETGIERTLQDLVGHLQSLREDTAAAAGNAARAAMQDMASRPQAQPSGLAELSTLVSGLRETNMSSGRQTQDAIGAVHQTLETIISRLASLEAELGSDRRDMARAPAPPRHVGMPAARGLESSAGFGAASEDRLVAQRPGRTMAAAPDAPGMPSLDMPLEPGSGRPRADGVITSAQDPQSIRQNLIAAARRSARAATDAAAQHADEPPQPAAAEAAGVSRLRSIMEKRRRPLLLGLAAIVLAMGAAHVVTGALKGGKPRLGEAEAVQAPALAAPEAVAPDAPARAKDQTSALPSLPIGATQALAAVNAAAPASADSAPPPPPAAPLPPIAAPERVQPVTGLGEIPATLGEPGLRKAALAGDARAVYELASRAADGAGVARDPRLAQRLFERAAVAGLAPAQFRVGNMFEKGVGTARDIALASVWYARAAERGNVKAMHNLAVLHAEGVSGKPDYATATEWFRRAAEHGVRDSQYNLAILLGRGLGAPADLAQSYLWFAVAAAQGDQDAGRKRDEVATRMSVEDLAAAKVVAAGWKAKVGPPEANEVTPPAKGWDDAPTASARKPAKPARS